MGFRMILATGSSYRCKMLENAGIPFEARKPDIDERSLEKSFRGPLGELSSYLALKKAENLKSLFPDRIVIGSDQVLIFNEKSFSKPESEEETIERLKLLQGKTHFLSTAIAVFYRDESKPVYKKTIISTMTMYQLCEDEIVSYVKEDKPTGCVGGYLFEKKGALLFKEAKTSDPYSIIGFPLLSLVDWLRKEGFSEKKWSFEKQVVFF